MIHDKSMSFFFLILAIVASNLLGSAIAAMIKNDNDKQEDKYTQIEERIDKLESNCTINL